MADNKMVELLELDQKRKWEYLKRYYEAAAKFYNIKDKVVSDKEIDECIKRFKEKPVAKIRKEVKLKEWNFKFDEKDQGVREGYYSFKYDEKEWEKATIPHSYRYIPEDPVRYGRTLYKILAPEEGQYWDIWKGEYGTWYKKRLPVDRIAEDEIAYLRFDSVNLLSDVWVNENPVMMNHLGLFPFKMEITEEMNSKAGREAVIALKVTNHATNTPYLFYNGLQVAYANPPYSNGSVKMDSYDQAWSGIAGEATLLILNRNHIEDVFIFTEDIVEGEAFLKCRLELRNATWERFCGKVRVEISKWLPQEGKAIERASKEVMVLPMNETNLEIGFKIENPDLWSIDSPNMYLAHVILSDADGVDIDDMCESFGVRTIKMRGSNFYLSNKKIVPRGTHDTSNYSGESLICPSDRAIVRDILLHKKMGATCSRWPSDMRMHYKRIAEYGDQLGFMISWTGYFEMWTVHPEMELYAKRDAKAMVRSLRNCPSIIIWEMGDEPLMLIHHQRRFKWYEQIYNLVKEEDQSRPIIPAGYYSNELVDLIVGYQDKSLSSDEKRQRVLEDYPLFNLELAPWDYHYCPTVPPPRPNYTVINMVKDALGGQRPTVFTEFGMDGIPKPANIIDIYGKFRWLGNQNWYEDKKKEATHYYGREIKQEDWRETQAAQALVLSNIIGHLRESPEEFAAFYLVTLIDPWTFYWGVVDANYNAKLSYFVVQSCYSPLYISGLHGNTILSGKNNIEIMVSNFEGTVSGASLAVSIKDGSNKVVKDKEFSDITIKGNASVGKVGELDLGGISPGLYSIEYLLSDKDGKQTGKMMELFFFEKSLG